MKRFLREMMQAIVMPLQNIFFPQENTSKHIYVRQKVNKNRTTDYLNTFENN